MRYLILWLSILLGSEIYALSDTVHVSGNIKYEGISFIEHVLLLEDENQSFTFPDLLNDQPRSWTPLSEHEWSGRFQRGRSDYWLKFHIHNDINKEIDLAFHFGNADTMKVQVHSDGRLLYRYIAGKRLEQDEMSAGIKNIPKSDVVMKLKEATTYTVLVKYVARPAMSPIRKATYWRATDRVAQEALKTTKALYFNGLSRSLTLIMVILALIQYVIKRDRLYLFYSMYTLLLFIFYFREIGYNNNFFIVPLWLMHTSYHGVLSFLIFLFYLLFAIKLLDIKEEFPFVHYFLRVTLGLVIVAFIVNRIIFIYDPWYAWKFLSYVKFFIFFVNVGLSIVLLKSKDLIVRLFILGAFLLIFANVCAFLLGFTDIHFRILNLDDEITYLGVLCESVIFYVILVLRSNRIQKENFKLEVSNVQLSELSNYKDHFYANLSHDFKTPISVIKGVAEGIISPPDSKDTILRNLDQLSLFVDQAMEEARSKAAEEKLNEGEADLALILKMLTENIQSAIRYKELTLSFHSFEKQLMMNMDVIKFQRIIMNLITNAIDHTPEYGQVKVTLAVQEQSGQEMAVIEVVDNGEGIKESEIPFIFDRYYSTGKEGKHMGLGLHIVKKYVEMMGGRIVVESEVKKGTRFTISLPVLRTGPSDKDLTSGVKVGVKPLKEREHSILIVDDSYELRLHLKGILELKYNVHLAENADNGMAAAIAKRPDIIITDVVMPGKSGLELCAEIKAHPELRAIPVILLTARSKRDDRMEGLLSQANAYLLKPLEGDELLLVIRNLLNHQERVKDSSRLISSGAKSMKFIMKVDSILEDHYGDEKFTASQLGEILSYSRSQLHKKVSEESGLSPAKYIRAFRLEKARKLLVSTEENISEVAFSVGFKSSSWFTQAYQEAYGESPSETRRK